MTEPETAEAIDNLGAKLGIMKGATINMVGTLVHLMLVFGYSIFLARVLSPDDLGRYFIGFAILGFLVIVALLGLDFTIWRYVPLFIGEGKTERARGVVLSSLMITFVSSLIIGGFLFLSADWLGETFFNDRELDSVFKFFAVALPFTVVARIFNASTQGLKLMRYQVLSKDLGEQGSKFLLSAFLLSFGLVGILYANVLAAAIAALLAFIFLQSKLPVIGGYNRSFRQLRLIASFSLPLIFSTIFSFLMIWVDTLLLGYFRGPDEVGLYGIALRVAILGTLVLSSFNTMFSPFISDLYNRRELKRLGVLFSFVTKWVVTCSLPIFIIVILFADQALSLFGARFMVVSSSLMVLAVGQFINSGTGPVAGMVLMSGRAYLDLANNLLAVALNVVLCLILIPPYGIIGAAVANGVATASINVIRAVEVYLIMGVQGYNRTFLKPLLAGAVAGTLSYVIFHYFSGNAGAWLIFVLAAAFLTSYTGLLAIMGFDEEDRAMARIVKDRLDPAKTA